MKERVDADRNQEIKESLIGANVGCALVFVLVIGVPIMGLGGFFIFLGFSMMSEQAKLDETAITVPATVISSEVQQTNTGTSSASYRIDIEFTYTHEGEVRHSNKVWPVEESGSAADMRAIADRYPLGARSLAFMDPADPDVAFLEKRWSQMPYVAVSIGCLSFVFVTAVGVWVAGWKRPGIATMIALVAGAVVLIQLLLASGHFSRHVPSSEQQWWVWLLLVASGSTLWGLLVSVIEARRLNHIYRAAIDSRAPSQGASS